MFRRIHRRGRGVAPFLTSGLALARRGASYDVGALSLGVGVVLNRPLEELPGSLGIDLHGQLSVLPEVAVENDNPADFVGDYRADGTMLNLGGDGDGGVLR
ncbi:hypothetical protein WME95_21905 [Sorangium sp. So ce327]|jgi:hypothetical protein|uniref:hypothetical protein n=1 Tax=unclassified Sorangium TaxID=2621164 RepID=UPI003F5F99F3